MKSASHQNEQELLQLTVGINSVQIGADFRLFCLSFVVTNSISTGATSILRD
jgi:hypothetical protein